MGVSLSTPVRRVMAKVKLDNLDKDDGTVLVMARWEDVKDDQSIAGSKWEHDNDFAYAIVTDHSGLIKELEGEGYDDLDLSEYCEPEEG